MSTTFYNPNGRVPHRHMNAQEARAQVLRTTALDFADQLFDQGDLSPYLDILVRLNFLNFYNLLLVLNQYPSATHLGSYNSWENWMKCHNPDTKWILKADQRGKGIELIVPFTHLQPDGSGSLSWYGLRQFDVSQINTEHYSPPKSVYLTGPDHLLLLIRSLRSVLAEQYHTVVQADLARAVHPVSYFEDNTIHCSPTIHDEEMLMLLTEHLLKPAIPEQVIDELHRHLSLQMTRHCLYRIWGMKDRRMLFLSVDPDEIRGIAPDFRPTFLDLLQRQVRYADELVCSKYQAFLLEREEEALALADLI